MQTLAQWLKRKPAGPKPKRPLKRCRVKKVSAKRQREARIYSVKRKAFLEAHPWCMILLRRMGVDESALCYDETGAAYINICGDITGRMMVPRATQVHHVFKRGKFYLDESTWLAASDSQHRWVHENPSLARAKGLLA